MESRRLPVLALLALLGVGAAAAARLLAEGDAGHVMSESHGDHTKYTVHWMEGVEYEDILANCGDEVEFVWEDGMHNVGIAADGECESITPITEPSNSGSHTFTLNEEFEEIEEYGEIYFACSVGRHCDAGQKLEFYVTPCKNSSMY